MKTEPSPAPDTTDPVIRKHPTFARNVGIIAAAGIVTAGLLFLNVLYGSNAFSGTAGIILTGVAIAVVIAAGCAARKFVRCPACAGPCEDWPTGEGEGQRIICTKCGAIWDLGISYNADTE